MSRIELNRNCHNKIDFFKADINFERQFPILTTRFVTKNLHFRNVSRNKRIFK